MEIITAVSNQKVQWLRSLIRDKKARDSEGMYIAEGVNFIKDIDKTKIDSYCMTESGIANFAAYIDESKPIVVVSDKVMMAISDTVTPCGVLAVVKKSLSPVDCMSITVVADNIADPANLGVIIRTMIACGVHNLLLYGDCVDVYSPKVVRATMGGITKLNIAKLTDIKFLPYQDVFVLDMNGMNIYDMPTRTNNDCFALVVGSEARGVAKEWRNEKFKIVSLPMKGEMESLNAGVSLSVALYQLVFGNN